MAEKLSVKVGVNGTTYTRDVEPRDLLVYFIREELGLTGTRVGCDTSSCEDGRNASLVARKALVACFARADQAPTPAESISAIMVCQQQMPH